jgi:IS30 family transposase
MAQQVRPGLSPAKKAELWKRWKKGESLSDIGRALGKNVGSIHWVVGLNGGIVPRTRRRSLTSLTLYEREEISRGVAMNFSLRKIANAIRRAPSTVSREIFRNGGRENYRASLAEEQAWEHSRRPKLCKLATNEKLQRIVAKKLKDDWSPEQISGWLKLSFFGDEAMQISHETIYRSLYIQARGVLKRELIKHLRSNRTMRRSKLADTKGHSNGQITDAISISERPPEVEDRAIPGHWEGDLIAGRRNSYIATLVERHSRYTMLVKTEGKDTTSVVSALIREVGNLPTQLRKSLTWDRGMELARHKDFTVATDVDVYFCDPRSPWQRGSNENTNGLLRQYFPKGTLISCYSQEELNAVASKLNQRPRKTLGFLSPVEKLGKTVALTG